jgi:hypothetical protein
MNRIVEFYEANHLLVLIVLIVVFGIYIQYTKHKNRYIVSSENEINEDEEVDDNKISIGSIIKLKYILTGEVVTLQISENQSNKNKTEIRRLHYKMPLAVSLLGKETDDIVKFKISELDNNEVFVEVLNVNNTLFTEEEIAFFKKENLEKIIDSEKINKKEQPSKQIEIMEPIRNIEQSKCFFIRRNRLGDNIIVEFTDIYGVIWQYDHDLVYKELQNIYENMPAFINYNCYTSSRTIPRYVQVLDCVNIINNHNT